MKAESTILTFLEVILLIDNLLIYLKIGWFLKNVKMRADVKKTSI